MNPVSLRVRNDEEAALLRRIARAMKTTPKVQETLRTALDALEAAYAMRLPAGFSDLPGAVVHLQATLAAAERRLAKLEENQAVNVMVGTSARAPAMGPNAWVTGTGTQRRLTDEGEVEFARRVARGDTNRQIVKAFGLSDSSVRTRRAKLVARLADGTEPLTCGEGKQKRFTKAGLRELARLFETGWSDEQLAERFEMDVRTIRQRRGDNPSPKSEIDTTTAPDAAATSVGMDGATKAPPRKSGQNLPKELRAQLAELAATTELSAKEIGRRLGVHRKTARKAILDHRRSQHSEP